MRGFIAPGKYLQGEDILKQLPFYVKVYSRTSLVIIDEFFYNKMAQRLQQQFIKENMSAEILCFGGEVTTAEIHRLDRIVEEKGIGAIIGIGGGKTIDTAKAVADDCGISLIIAPTAASNDAPCSSLSIIYDSEVSERVVRKCRKNPDLVLADSRIIREAPTRFLLAGIGDALATYLEARANAQSGGDNFIGSNIAMTELGMAVAATCHKIILKNGIKAVSDQRQGVGSKELEDVIEANILLSGIGFENTGCAAAHSVSKGLSGVKACAALLHGEKVAYGCLVHLAIENRVDELKELLNFYRKIGLPVTLEEMGVTEPIEEVAAIIADKSMNDGFWEHEPMKINREQIIKAVLRQNKLGSRKEEWEV